MMEGIGALVLAGILSLAMLIYTIRNVVVICRAFAGWRRDKKERKAGGGTA